MPLFCFSDRKHSRLQGKVALSNRIRTAQGSTNQAISKSRDNDPFDRITQSDIEDAAPKRFVIDANDTEAIYIEYTNDFQNPLPLSEYSLYICYFYSIRYCSFLNKYQHWFRTFTVSQKRNKYPVPYKPPPLRYHK